MLFKLDTFVRNYFHDREYFTAQRWFNVVQSSIAAVAPKPSLFVKKPNIFSIINKKIIKKVQSKLLIFNIFVIIN